MRISVPGNLLLLGEYAVLEEGGLGLALALEKRLHLELQPLVTGNGHDPPAGGRRRASQHGPIVEGHWQGGGLRWSPADPESSPLINAVTQSCLAALRREAAVGELAAGARQPEEALIHIDSSAFFAEGGTKSGFGSSAAVAVALSWALLAWGGVAASRLSVTTLEAALQGHRLAQGGAGSGYDVFASCLGGLGLFTGGQSPSWQPLDLPWLGPLVLLRSGASVATSGAVGRYRDWKAFTPGKARWFLKRSNLYLRRFLSARSWDQASGWFAALTDLGIWLGEAIGVPARIQRPVQLPGGRCKALGAGNELAACLVPAASRPAEGWETVQVSREGVVWQP